MKEINQGNKHVLKRIRKFRKQQNKMKMRWKYHKSKIIYFKLYLNNLIINHKNRIKLIYKSKRKTNKHLKFKLIMLLITCDKI